MLTDIIGISQNPNFFLENKFINSLIKSVEGKDIPNNKEILQKKLIANQQIFNKLKEITIKQIKEFTRTFNPKYSINRISSKIGYKNQSRLKNTIIELIGSQLYSILFKYKHTKYSLKDIIKLAEKVGQERYGKPGKVTLNGIGIFRRDVERGLSPTNARVEIWCQSDCHQPFIILIRHLQQGHWCSRCFHESRVNSFEDAIYIGLIKGYLLIESIKSYYIKIRNKGEKHPCDIKLEWVCVVCGNSYSRSIANIGKTRRCISCYHATRQITYLDAIEEGKKKGLELAMSFEQFEKAKKDAKHRGLDTSQSSLRWKLKGMYIQYTFSYVAWQMEDRLRYKDLNYISPTGHRSSEGENHGRWVLQQMFEKTFDHTLLKDIVGAQVRISGKAVKIHPRMHVDGFDVVRVNGRDFKVAYEFWEMYFHNKPNSRKKDELKQTILSNKNLIFIVLTDAQDPADFQEIIARQFEQQTGVLIRYQAQYKLDVFLR